MSIGFGGRGMPSRDGLGVEAEVELEFEVEFEPEAEASSCFGFFDALCVGFAASFLCSSCFVSAGAEASAAAPGAEAALGSALASALASALGSSGVTGAIIGLDCAASALLLPGCQIKLSARPVGAVTVSPFARTFVASASPWMGLLPGAPSNSSESFGVSVAFPVSGTTGPISGRSAGLAPDGEGSTGPEGSATGTRLLI